MKILRELRNGPLLCFTLLLSSLLDGTARIEPRTVMFQNLSFSIHYSAFWNVSVGLLPYSQLCPWCQWLFSGSFTTPFVASIKEGVQRDVWVYITVLRSCCSHAFQWPEHRCSNHRTQSAGSNGNQGSKRSWGKQDLLAIVRAQTEELPILPCLGCVRPESAW